MRVSRWLIVLPAVLLSFFPFVARADAVQGLVASYYVIDEVPPQQSTSLYTLCASEVENNINRSYDGEPVDGCPDDLFMVHLSGFISIPEHESIEFMLASDDGGEITIGGNTFGVWYDQGCTWTMSGNLSLEASSVPLQLFMYENGGGTCLMLAWKIDDGDWEIVPDEAFSTIPVASTTTDVSTTTVVESTTSSAPTTTSLPVEPTMPEQSTTSSTTTTSTVVDTTTTTELAAPPVAQPPATVPPPPTTQLAPPDTEPTPPETQPNPPETAPQPPETAEATIPPVEVTSPLDAPQAPETLPIVDTVPAPPETVPARPDVKEALTEEQFDAVIEQLSEATEEQIVALVNDLITKDLDTSQAAAFVSSPAVLAAITGDQAKALFEEISTGELSEAEAEQVVAAVQDAPPSVRKAFESVLNIFSGFADNYVPFDSRIPVSERRALVALGAVLLAASPAPTLRRRQ